MHRTQKTAGQTLRTGLSCTGSSLGSQPLDEADENMLRPLLCCCYTPTDRKNTNSTGGIRPLASFPFIGTQTIIRDHEMTPPPPSRETKGYKEQQDLVVLQSTTQAHEGNQEQEGTHADDHCHHPDAGDQAEPFPPGCHSNQQQTHQLWKRRSTLMLTREKEEDQPRFWGAYVHSFEDVEVESGWWLHSVCPHQVGWTSPVWDFNRRSQHRRNPAHSLQ